MDVLVMAPDFIPPFFAAAGSLAGYAFREYRNRVTPFLQIVNVSGDNFRNSDSCKLDANVINQLKAAASTEPLTERSTLKEVYGAWDSMSEISINWPKYKDKVHAFLANNAIEEYRSLLWQLFRYQHFDDTLTRLLTAGKLSVPSADSTLQPILDSFYDPDGAWIVFPNGNASLGTNYKTDSQIVQKRLSPFLDLVIRLEIPKIQSVLADYEKILSEDYYIANEVVAPLKAILDISSRWMLECYVANVDSTPLIIEPNASIIVRDRRTINYVLRGSLLAAPYSESGDSLGYHSTSTPIIIRSGEDARFAIVTNETQGELIDGSAVRECFSRGVALCRIKVFLRKVGLLRRQSYLSPSIRFAEPKSSPK
jgi:hypothetical protein